jgi:outer membrane protein
MNEQTDKHKHHLQPNPNIKSIKTRTMNRVMKMCSCVLVAAGMISSSVAQTNSPGKLGLKQAVDIAIKNNLDVRQRELQSEVAEANWKEAKANRIPYLEGFANHGINQGRSIDPFTNQFSNQQITFAGYGVNAGVVLFNGFNVTNFIRQNALLYDATKMEVQQNKDLVTMNVILAYLQVLSNSELLTQSRNQAELSRKQTERLEELNKAGAISPVLLSDLKGQLAADELAIVNSQNALDGARLSLCQLMNVPYDKNLQVEPLTADQVSMVYEATPEQIYQTAEQNLPMVKAANLRRQSAEKGVKAAKGLLYPTLSLNGNVTTNYSSVASKDVFVNTTEQETRQWVAVNGIKSPVIAAIDNYNSEKIKYGDQLNNNLFTSVELALRIPVFNALQARTRVRLAKIDEKNTEIVEETTRIQLRQNIEQAYFNMTAAQNRYTALVSQVTAFTESFRIAEEKFNAGAATSVDYLVARTNVDRANINLITARYDYVLRTKILDYYQSKPLW